MKNPTKILSPRQNKLIIKQNKAYSLKTGINKNRNKSADIHYSKRANMNIKEANEIFLNSGKINRTLIPNKEISLSVIMPYYKKKKFVEESLNSVLNQTYKDFENIVEDQPVILDLKLPFDSKTSSG